MCPGVIQIFAFDVDARAAEVAVLFRASDHCDAGLVGAAVLAESGAVYTGCSVDLRCGIGFCAEHSAVAELLKHHEARVRAVVAVNDGTIKEVGKSKELGNYIILEDAYGNSFIYGGLGKVAWGVLAALLVALGILLLASGYLGYGAIILILAAAAAVNLL